MASSRDLIDARDREILEAAGYGRPMGLGNNPALLVVDVTYGFVGREPQPILESIQTYPSSCGDAGWRAIEVIEQLLSCARARRIPVMYSAGTGEAGLWAVKRPNHASQPFDAYDIVERIAPRPSEIVIRKPKPSAFFRSPLAQRLRELSVDSLIICGGTTSGCVRATVVDAFSHDIRVTVVEDAVFDRVELSHAASLLDMQQKYADVRPAGAVIRDLQAYVGHSQRADR